MCLYVSLNKHVPVYVNYVYAKVKYYVKNVLCLIPLQINKRPKF